jgi:hypothetical protein
MTGTLDVQENVLKFSEDAGIWASGENLIIGEPEDTNKVWATFTDDTSFHLSGIPNLIVDGTGTFGGALNIGRTSSGRVLDMYGSNLDLTMRLGEGTASGYAEYGFYWTYFGTQTGNDNDISFFAENQGGTDVEVWECKQDGAWTFKQPVTFAGNVSIGESIPTAKLHIFTGDSGFSGAIDTDYDELCIEGNGNVGLTILSPEANYGSIVFGDNADKDMGRIKYYHGDNSMSFFVNNRADYSFIIDSAGRATFYDTGSVDRDGLTTSREGHTIGIGVDRTSTYWGGAIYTDGTKRVLIDGNGGVAIGSTVVSATPPTNGLLIGYTGGSYGSDATGGIINQNSSSGRATFRNRTVNDDSSEIFFDVNGALRWDFSCRGSGEGYKMNLYPQAASPVYNSVSQTQFTWFQNGNVQIKKSGAADTGYALHVGGTIYADSDVIAYSDIISKTNLEPIENALEKVSSITGYTFNRKADDSRRFTGMVAQEVESVLPEAVYTNTNGTKGLAYSNTIGLLIEAIKELKNEINQLKGEA